MPSFKEGNLQFDFPESFEVCQYDKSHFYVSQHGGFRSIKSGTKAVDFIAFEALSDELWFIEVKDFRAQQRENKERQKTEPLVEEIVDKMIFSIAGLFVMGFNGEGDEKTFAQKALSKSKLRIVFHLEQLSEREVHEIMLT
ncbi:MAG: hypothetical protein RLZZ156_766 [Deinococcota bacterium]